MMTDIFPSDLEHHDHDHDPLTPVPSLSHLSYPSLASLISWDISEEDTPLYALSLVQDANAIDLHIQSDIIIAYVQADPTFNSLKCC